MKQFSPSRLVVVLLIALAAAAPVPGRGEDAADRLAQPPVAQGDGSAARPPAPPPAPPAAVRPARGDVAAAPSGWAGVGVNAKVSTLGFGGEVVARGRWLGLRAGANGYHRTTHGTESDVRYRLEFSWFTPDAMVDVFPFGGSFRLSGGGALNRNRIDLTAVPEAAYVIGGTVYTAADLVTLTGRLDFRPVSPYAGLGWDLPLLPGKHLLMVVDLGVLFQGDPRVTLASTGPLSTDPAFQANLQAEQREIESDLAHRYRYYPVLGLGFSLRF